MLEREREREREKQVTVWVDCDRWFAGGQDGIEIETVTVRQADQHTN